MFPSAPRPREGRSEPHRDPHASRGRPPQAKGRGLGLFAERKVTPTVACGGRPRQVDPARTKAYRSSTSAVDLAYAVDLASKKSVFTMLALLYWLTHCMSAGSSS